MGETAAACRAWQTLTNFAIVVKCGWLSPEMALNSTFWRHSVWISRLRTMPLL